MSTTFREAASQDSKHGEMFMYEESQAVTINVSTAQYHGVVGFSQGTIDGWTMGSAGLTGTGNITTAAGGTAININDGTHGLVTGDVVAVQSASHSGSKVITKINNDNFTVPISYSGDETGYWQMGGYLLAGADAAGDYELEFSVSGQSASNSKEFQWELNHNLTAIDTVVAQRKHTVTDMGSYASGGVVADVAAGDIIWLSVKNITDATNFTIRHVNVNIVRI